MQPKEALDTKSTEKPFVTTNVLVSFECSNPLKFTIIYPERSDSATLNRSVTITIPADSNLLEQMVELLSQVGITSDKGELEYSYGSSFIDEVTTLSLSQQKDGTLILNPMMSKLIQELTQEPSI